MGIAEPFDVEDYSRSAHGSLRDDFSLREFEEVPLDREAIVATAYLRALEHAIVARVLPVARTHPDARVRGFASAWAAERHRIADALGDVLTASPRIRGIETRPPEPIAAPSALRARVAGLLPGPVALVLAVDAHVSLHAYRRLARLSLHPEMERLADAVTGILERHADFFGELAAARLGRPLPGRIAAAALLLTLRLPIGESDLPEPLAREGRELVFGRDDGGLDRIDAAVTGAFCLPCSAAQRLAQPHRAPSLRAAAALGRRAADVVHAVRSAREAAEQARG